MSSEQLQQLEKSIMNPPVETTGCALWNVRQRLIYHFGPEASILFHPRPKGGVAVHIHWTAMPQLK
ncbi:hypothetical protein D3C78_1437810 [compost metagenome]